MIWFSTQNMQHVVVDQILEPGRRVTVAMGANRNLDSGNQLIFAYLFYFVLLKMFHDLFLSNLYHTILAINSIILLWLCKLHYCPEFLTVIMQCLTSCQVVLLSYELTSVAFFFFLIGEICFLFLFGILPFFGFFWELFCHFSSSFPYHLEVFFWGALLTHNDNRIICCLKDIFYN